MSRTGRVLVLGGTGEARRLATALVADGVDVLGSPTDRADDLAGWLSVNRADVVVDATHSFATTMTASAVAAAERVGVPLLRLQRAGWTAQPGDDWRWVDSLEGAAAAISGFDRVFLATGRQGLAAFAGVTAHCLVRSVDPPEPPLPESTTVVLERGPFSLDDERALLREHAVQVIVTKDSGGSMTAAKLTAARELGLPVVVLRRPPLPPGVPSVATVAEALAWVRGGLEPGASPMSSMGGDGPTVVGHSEGAP